MKADGIAVFDTALGTCGVAWNTHGLCASQLPEGDAAALRARLQRRLPGTPELEPPDWVQRLIDALVSQFHGTAVDLSQVPLDLRDVPDLDRRVYDIVRHIPCGATLSYGQIAERLGDRQLARAVGRALGRNPFAPVVPCHRVLAAGGRPGGFSAHGGLRTKLQLLILEGASPGGEPDLFATPRRGEGDNAE